jgi:Tol biopolymer transport system component
MVQDVETRSVTPLPDGPSIPKGSGSSIPDVANLSWSPDGTKLVFEFGRSAQDRVIYLANADGSGMTKVVDSAHAPAISADGNCLAYISNKHVFLIDLASSNSTTPLLLAELPTGRGTPDFRLDKLQWSP